MKITLENWVQSNSLAIRIIYLKNYNHIAKKLTTFYITK